MLHQGASYGVAFFGEAPASLVRENDREVQVSVDLPMGSAKATVLSLSQRGARVILLAEKWEYQGRVS